MVTKATRDVVDLSIREITSGLRVAGNNSVNFRINGTTIGLDLASDGAFVNLTATNVTSTNLTVTGNTSGDGFGGFTPIGGVIMFNAAFATIPANWQLCDGTNGTPNMTDRFVYGTNTEGQLLTTGGSANSIVVAHIHTMANAGSHTHDLNLYDNNNRDGNNPNGISFTVRAGTATTKSAGNHKHTVNSTGSSGTGANLPPYIKLAFIQRMS